jgi:transposase
MTGEEETELRAEVSRLSRVEVENAALRAENERLTEENERLRRELEQQGEQVAGVMERIAELERRGGKRPSFVKPNRPKGQGSRGERKKRAARHNKSRQRGQPTRVERHVLERCPECDYRLRGESVSYRREVVELPPPQRVEVIEHQVIKRWCPRCEQWRSPRLDLSGQVLGRGRIGVRIASLVVYLRTTMRLPIRAIQEYLETLHGLRLSVGEIQALTHGARRRLQAQAEALKAAVQTSTVVHGDETGWREDGQNGYVWAFATSGPRAVRYFEHHRSRGHAVPKQILGPRFRGWLVSDFYSAYNLIPGRHQRCWVHLLRDLHALKEQHEEDRAVVEWATAVRQVYDEAQGWLGEHPQAPAEEREAAYSQAFTRACALGQPYARTRDHPCQTLAKRLLRHQDELFQFLLVPGLPGDNNLVERSLRPLVIIRKISGGSRSEQGTITRLTLASLLQTWAARNLNPFHQCLAALQQPIAHAPP